jgi:hypothetical protein
MCNRNSNLQKNGREGLTHLADAEEPLRSVAAGVMSEAVQLVAFPEIISPV